LAFGFQRAADKAGATLGLVIALGVVWRAQAGARALDAGTWRTLVLLSLAPAAAAVLALALGAREVPAAGGAAAVAQRPRITLRGLGRPFAVFLLINAVFDLGNSSDAFLVLRAQERGLSVSGILAMLISFNVVYTVVATPAGRLSDRVGRRRLIVGGWLVYAAIYFGLALAQAAWQVWALYVVYGLYYGLAFGASKAMVADLVPEALRGTAYGTYHAVLGAIDFPASLAAGVLWQGVGAWPGLGAAAPFAFGGGLALVAALALAAWRPAKA
jgi:MFS family permease